MMSLLQAFLIFTQLASCSFHSFDDLCDISLILCDLGPRAKKYTQHGLVCAKDRKWVIFGLDKKTPHNERLLFHPVRRALDYNSILQFKLSSLECVGIGMHVRAGSLCVLALREAEWGACACIHCIRKMTCAGWTGTYECHLLLPAHFLVSACISIIFTNSATRWSINAVFVFFSFLRNNLMEHGSIRYNGLN